MRGECDGNSTAKRRRSTRSACSRIHPVLAAYVPGDLDGRRASTTRATFVSITTSPFPSNAGNHGVKPGARAGVDSALTNIVASLRPTRWTGSNTRTNSSARIAGSTRRSCTSRIRVSNRPSFQSRSHAEVGSLPMSPIRPSETVACFTWHGSDDRCAQSTPSAVLWTSQRASNASSERRCSHGDARAANRIVAVDESCATSDRDIARCCAMMTVSRRAWNIDSATKSWNSADGLPAARSAGSTAKYPTRSGSQ